MYSYSRVPESLQLNDVCWHDCRWMTPRYKQKSWVFVVCNSSRVHKRLSITSAADFVQPYATNCRYLGPWRDLLRWDPIAVSGALDNLLECLDNLDGNGSHPNPTHITDSKEICSSACTILFRVPHEVQKLLTDISLSVLRRY